MQGADSFSRIINIMGTKQKWHIMRCLLIGHTKFNQIKRDCNMSSASLSRTLKYLESRGLVTKRISKSQNPSSEYLLTKAGLEFSDAIDALSKLGKRI